MTAPSPRLRTAWRVGSALAAAAGSAVVTSALVNRTRGRSQRKQASTPTDAAPGPTPLTAAPPPVGAPPAPAEIADPPVAHEPSAGQQVPGAPAGPAADIPPAGGAELLVHDPAPGVQAGVAAEVSAAGDAESLVRDPVAAGPPEGGAPAGPARVRSDDLARAIEAADAVEAAPAAWARAASDLRTRTAAGDTGWAPPATALPAMGEMRVPPGPPTPAVGTAAALAAEPPVVEGSPGWDYGLSGDVDSQFSGPKAGQEDRRRPRRRHRTGPEDLAAAAGGTAAPPAPTPVDAEAQAGGSTTVTGAPRSPDAGNGPGGPTGGHGDSAGEVTPDRRLLLFIGVAVAVALLLGLGVVVLGGGDDGPEQADATPTADDAGTDGDSNGDTGSQPATTPVAQLTPAQAFAQAGQRLQAAGTFAYEGTSSATDVSPVRPGPWMGVELTVEGQVQLSPLRLLERGTAGDGTVGETVTDGVTIWGRSAPGSDALAEQTLQTLYTLPDPTPAEVGALLLPQWLTSATGATDAGVDSQGRRTFQATLPAGVLGTIEDDRAPVDAVLLLVLDEQGDPAHLEVTTAASGPPLRLVYDIDRLGDDMSIPIPGQSQSDGTGTSPQSTTTSP